MWPVSCSSVMPNFLRKVSARVSGASRCTCVSRSLRYRPYWIIPMPAILARKHLSGSTSSFLVCTGQMLIVRLRSLSDVFSGIVTHTSHSPALPLSGSIFAHEASATSDVATTSQSSSASNEMCITPPDMLLLTICGAVVAVTRCSVSVTDSSR